MLKIIAFINDNKLKTKYTWKTPFMEFEDWEIEELKQVFSILESKYDLQITLALGHNEFLRLMKEAKFDACLHFASQGWQNDLSTESVVNTLCDYYKTPYYGPSKSGIAICFSKYLQLCLAQSKGIKVAAPILLPSEVDFEKNSYWFVRPVFGEGKVGIDERCIVANNQEIEQFQKYYSDEYGYQGEYMAQPFIEGYDTSFTILGTPKYGMVISPPVIVGVKGRTILSHRQTQGFEEPTQVLGYPDITAEKTNDMVSQSMALAAHLGLYDYYRPDWRISNDGIPHFMELNPNASWGGLGFDDRRSKLNSFNLTEYFRILIFQFLRRCGHEADRLQNLDYIKI